MMYYKFFQAFVLASLAFSLFSCQSDKNEPDRPQGEESTLFTLLEPDVTGIDFTNAIQNQKEYNIFKYRNFYNGGGVAIGDINNDDLPDVFLTANMGENKLYLNKGDFKFDDISKPAGITGSKPWSTGVVMVDINQDGFLDIYVNHAGHVNGDDQNNELYINNGDLTFTEKASDYNLDQSGFSVQTAFFDYDKDGDLDAYILNNSNIPVNTLGYAAQREKRAEDWDNVPYIFRGKGDMLLRNDHGKFIDVSEESGIYGSLIGFGLGVAISDINGDTYPDIYVTNDFYERDYLYINQGDGTFKEDIKNWTGHMNLSAMGLDIADINNDGNTDVYVTDMLPEKDSRLKAVMEFEGYNIFKLKQTKDFHQQYIQNSLQLNNGNNTFSEIANFSGVAATDWSWAALLFDMDNDGLRDIFVTNGINHDLTDLDFMDFFANDIIQSVALTGQKTAIDSIIAKMPIKPQPNYAFKNKGNLTFNNVNSSWGFDIPSMSNGAAYGDLDNDGDLDLIVNNVNMKAFVYRNNSELKTDNHYIKLKFDGEKPNNFAVGSKVKLYFGDHQILQELQPTRGFQSSMDYIMTIGMGEIQIIDSLRVIWPNDKTQLLKNVKANQFLTLHQADAKTIYKPSSTLNPKTFLSELPNTTFLSHEENTYSDFDYEGLISKMLSQEGPALAVGDVNGDGNDDFYIGGAKGKQGVLYINRGNGKINISSQKAFNKDAKYEDTAAAFFDADGDTDLDLMVGSGGNEVSDKTNYKPRLYINDGTGEFALSDQNMPTNQVNISVITPTDFDGDGDMDVFVGSRSVVGTYGVNPNQLLLENNGHGVFSDATQRVAYDLRNAGMVTDAIWVDVDNDSKIDLVTVSEWDTPKIYKNDGKRLRKISSDLDHYSGMWNVVKAVDLDQDGDLDFILGNQGTNTLYKATKANPMKLWINDFDNNGTIEQITTQFYDGKDYPIHMKKELTTQMVKLKKQNLKASEYAHKALDELFSKEIVDQSIMKTCDISETIVAVNKGNGQFTIKTLPNRVQFSCVCDVVYEDINDDGHLDLILAGNNFDFKPQFSRLDANYGSVLLNDGHLEFTWQDYSKSGFMVGNEVKHLNKIKDKTGKTYLLAAINNDKPKLFSFNE
ncbi:VCBS repeat-containing protein [Aestuariivivens sediminis]|uniref:VCBS repeat-containing protein n=1 Tax=Aestuariivivens sediminis TaxID=2913557 RepID=UPI003B84B591